MTTLHPACFFCGGRFRGRKGKLQMGWKPMLVISTCLAGFLLGLSFNFVVLLPSTLLGGAAYAFMFGSEGPFATSLSIAALAISLQAGYVLGLTGRYRVAQLRSRLAGIQSKRA